MHTAVGSAGPSTGPGWLARGLALHVRSLGPPAVPVWPCLGGIGLGLAGRPSPHKDAMRERA